MALDEFQYFSRKALFPLTSELQSELDRLAATHGIKGGLIVLGSLHTEMQALLEDRSDTEIDLVALDEGEQRLRLASCKRSAAALLADLGRFDGDVARFLNAFPRFSPWQVEEVWRPSGCCGLGPASAAWLRWVRIPFHRHRADPRRDLYLSGGNAPWTVFPFPTSSRLNPAPGRLRPAMIRSSCAASPKCGSRPGSSNQTSLATTAPRPAEPALSLHAPWAELAGKPGLFGCVGLSIADKGKNSAFQTGVFSP